MDNLTSNGNPRHCKPIDQEGTNGTTKSKGINRPHHEEYGGNGCYCEQDEFLENYHVSAFTVLSYSSE